MQKVWTLLAVIFIAAIFYRVAYVVPHNTCNDIWLHAERQQTDPERADFVAKCVRAVVDSAYFDTAYWIAKAQRPQAPSYLAARMENAPSGHGGVGKGPLSAG